MIYLLINKKSNKVMYTSDRKFSEYSDNLILVEVESLPQFYDYLIAENIREKTDTWEEVIEDYDDNGEIVAKTEERSRTYFTCDVIAKFKEVKPLTKEQKEKIRSEKIVKLIRKKYSLDEELAILRQKDSKPEKYAEFYAYAEDCVASVPKEV